MKNALIITALIFSICNISFAAEDLSKWKYQSNVTVTDSNNSYCDVTLMPEIYDAAKTDLSDLRLIDSSAKQIPYLIIKPKDITETTTYNPKTLNYSTGQNKAAFVTLDFEKQVLKNSIEVITEGNNFRRPVKIEGSNNNIDFFTVVEQAFIFAIGDRHNSRFSKIELPSNDFRYLRVSVEPMLSEEKSPVIKEVRTYDTKQKLAQRIPVKLTQLKQEENEKQRSSIYEYGLGFRNLPVTEITLDVADDAFYRYVTFEGRDAVTEKIRIESEDNTPRFKEVEVRWNHITSGTIYRYKNSDGQLCQNLKLSIPSEQARKFIKVSIRNYDNNPLKINSVSANMLPAKLIFPRPVSNATLYAGAESVYAPKYDLEYTLRNPQQIQTSEAGIGSIQENPLFGKKTETVPWTEKHKALLLAALCIVVLVLGGFIFKSFKSIQRTNGK